ncbi:hypothetical protein AB4Z29_00410 [Paenibacillus sp. 2TAB23]|uniref:hypothetical protein n=1 Tax=Paenibacillus sp. 2TAB23 TaxID=3233004 RepID=UPI003F9676C9
MKLIKSTRQEQTFYGDIFEINGAGCVVFGFGKTKACREAINNNEDNEIGLDFASLSRVNNDLYAHCEFEFWADNTPDPINDRVPIRYLLRMLDQDETSNLVNPEQIQVVSYEDFVEYSQFNINFQMPIVYTSEERNASFKSLTEGTNISGFLLVPWMNSHIEKGSLMRSFIK